MIPNETIPTLYQQSEAYLLERYRHKIRSLAFCLRYGYVQTSHFVERDARILASVIRYKRAHCA